MTRPALLLTGQPGDGQGTLKRFEWTNPHALIFLDVKGEKARSVEQEIELMSLNHLDEFFCERNRDYKPLFRAK